MSGATFSRLKNWTQEVLGYSDLNSEIDNILSHLDPTGLDGYSDTATMMKLMTNPGTTGSESLATSLAGELERLRFVLKAILGTSVTNWYDTPPTTLSFLSGALGTQTLANRIVSGRTTGNSSQLCALLPNGSTSSVVLTASSSTPFIYAVNNVNYTIASNVTVSGLSLAAGLNCTGANSVGFINGQQWTKGLGQYGTLIKLTNNGSVGAVQGQFAAFKHSNESFIAQLSSTAGIGFTAALTNAWRGCFFSSAGSGIAANSISDSEVFTLLKLTWIFANTNGSLAVSYTNPTYSPTQPSSPATGDYWYDIASTAWKTYNSTTWVAANSVLIGVCAQDTAACIAARTFDSYVAASDLNTTRLELASTASVNMSGGFAQSVNIFGSKLSFGNTFPSWSTASDFESGVTTSINTAFYCYMKEDGTTVLSDKMPMNRRDLLGYYHPRETWRCLGSVVMNASTQFESPVRTFRGLTEDMYVIDPAAYGKGNALGLASDLTDIMVDRVKLAQGSYTWATTQSQYADVVTLSLTPGIWLLNASAGLNVSAGSTAKSLWTIGLSNLTAGNSFVDRLLGFNAAQAMIPGNATISVGGTAYTTPIPYVNVLNVPPMFVAVSAADGTQARSWYLKLSIANTASVTYTLDSYSIVARRVDNLVGGNS